MTWSPFERGDALADLDDDARALMAHDGGKQAFGIGAGNGEFIGVANAGGLDFDQHLAFLGAVEINLDDFQRFAFFKGNGGARFHGFPSV